MQLGDFAFGTPHRITARVRLGSRGVVDIERESELGGPIHSKGVLILSGYLSGRYALNKPLAVGEPGVRAELRRRRGRQRLLGRALRAAVGARRGAAAQSLAVTGSVNQHGDVQAIGGVNEKIEGFFDLCRARGLSGDQGVLIPRRTSRT
jgi:predicted ATP-dependent protease